MVPVSKIRVNVGKTYGETYNVSQMCFGKCLDVTRGVQF
jgi:hypothetical protein